MALKMKKGEVKRTLRKFGISPPDGIDTPVYIFTSSKAENVWKGLKHRMWAVGDIKESQLAQRRTKALQLPVGGLGLFYCSDQKVFTAPFRIASLPEDRQETNIWPGVWHFPFKVEPFGDMTARISLAEAKRDWDVFKKAESTAEALNLSGAMSFVESWVSADDWRRICQRLCTDGKVVDAQGGAGSE